MVINKARKEEERKRESGKRKKKIEKKKGKRVKDGGEGCNPSLIG